VQMAVGIWRSALIRPPENCKPRNASRIMRVMFLSMTCLPGIWMVVFLAAMWTLEKRYEELQQTAYDPFRGDNDFAQNW
jgi:hypothetical protein